MKQFSICFAAALLLSGAATAQTAKKESLPNNWFQQDPATTSYNGISLDKAYALIKEKNLKSHKVIVAVIDSGIDTLHEDLRPILWTNPKELPGNNIDDDKNGYVDDVHGWNFIGGKDGRNVKTDSYEGARVYYALKPKWDNKEVDINTLNPQDKAEYMTFLRAKESTTGGTDLAQAKYLQQLLPKFLAGDSVLRKELGKEKYNGDDLKNVTSANLDAKMTRGLILNISKQENNYQISNEDLIEELQGQVRKLDDASTPPKNYRGEIVQDNEADINDKYYGNNDIMANTPMHGTHCSGIIAAVRGNGKGGDGVADNVNIMMIRAVPDGDEHDKDIANAIYYAVNNGARIISMSFGKSFSPQKQWVDDAFRYAESKGVLLVHAAGNDAKNVDTAYNFPNPVYADGKGRASNIITVGASGDVKNGGLTASFSNYGKSEVDVFAPGVGIYSTIPGTTTYGNLSGTSMACPVVAGVAALLLEYFPTMSPQQLKMAIEKSAVVSKEMVNKPGTTDKVALSDISKTGGFLNAYEAVKYASTMKTPEKVKEKLPNSKIKVKKKD
jgi:subtilisin family serine protease